MMFDTFYGLTVDEVLSTSAGIRERESHGSAFDGVEGQFPS